MKSSLKNRLIVGSLSVILLVVFVFFAPYPIFKPIFVALLATVVGIAFWEFLHIARLKESNPMVKTSIIFSICYIFANFLAIHFEKYSLLPNVVLFVAFVTIFIAHLSKIKHAFVDIAITFLGFLYIVVPLSLIADITYCFPGYFYKEGAKWLAYLLIVTKITDIFAYFGGNLFGKTPLAPNVSPNKTIEGTTIGVFAAVITSVVFHYLTIDHLPVAFSLFTSIVLGLLIGVFGQIGDLAESLLKRDVKVKDSNKIPGLGGVLDMVDSLLFTTPLIYFFLKLQFTVCPL